LQSLSPALAFLSPSINHFFLHPSLHPSLRPFAMERGKGVWLSLCESEAVNVVLMCCCKCYPIDPVDSTDVPITTTALPSSGVLLLLIVCVVLTSLFSLSVCSDVVGLHVCSGKPRLGGLPCRGGE
jgi:hypothetical protein